MIKHIWILCLLFPWISLAADVTFQWDANPPAEEVTEYCLYMDTVLQQCVPGTETTMELFGINPGPHEFWLTAKNMWGESQPSNSVLTPPLSGKPGSITIILVK